MNKEDYKEMEKQLENISEELELVRCDLHNRTSEINAYKKENEELYQKYINAVADYEQEKFKVEELKKQVEEYKLDIINGEPYVKLSHIINQQQEFMNYLEKEIHMHEENIRVFSKNYNSYFIEINELKSIKKTLGEILLKYKEIIGSAEDE